MELWDLYDKDGNRTGEIWERRHGNYVDIPEGRYHLVSDILVQHRDGSYLLTKRHQGKDLYPGYWEASAGGSAQLGEGPEACAKRELFEETGILCDSLELVKITFSNRSPSFGCPSGRRNDRIQMGGRRGTDKIRDFGACHQIER